MSNVKRISLMIGSLAVVGALTIGQSLAQKESPAVTALALEQQSQHASATQRITSLFTRSHYKNVVLEDGFSEKVFDRFLKTMDFNKVVLTQKDVDVFATQRKQIDDILK